MTVVNKTARLHALDALRAVMMLLGLVIHTVSTYAIGDYGKAWPMKDNVTTHWLFDVIGNWIHLFRMPVFFLVAGFFGALLFYERSPQVMLKNRYERIAKPLVVFLFALWPFIAGAFCSTLIAFDQPIPGLDPNADFHPRTLLPSSTFHLWFLYYLFMMSVLAFGMAKLLQKVPAFTQAFSKLWRLVVASFFVRLCFPIVILLGFLSIANVTWVDTSTAFIPAPTTLFFYGLFYGFGWLLFHHKDLLPKLQQGAWTLSLGGTFLFLVYCYLLPSPNDKLDFYSTILFNAITAWCLCLGIVGLFLRYLGGYSKTWRYVSDASYWIYLIHLPIVIFLPAPLSFTPFSAFLKVPIILFAATYSCFWTYKRWVRNTAIGEFLNGRRYAD